MIAGITAKLGRFQRSAVTRTILDSPNSSINFEDILAKNKILICNFSKGVIGEDTSALLGMVILAKLQLSAWKRSIVKIDQRSPFFLYVDEFQEFQASTFKQMVSDSRKYGVYLTIAEQTTAHQNDQEANVLLANMGSIICFRSVAPIDGKRIGPVFAPNLTPIDFANLEPYHFYARLSSTAGNEILSGASNKLKQPSSKSIFNKVTQSQQASNDTISA